MLFFFCLVLCVPVCLCGTLPYVDKARPDLVSVSGISSGAAFATQYHVAYSGSTMGVGMIAGVPYYCAKGSISTATTTCMTFPSTINVQSLISQAEEWSVDDMDDVAGIEGDKVYIWHGTADRTVNIGASRKTEEFYKHFKTDVISVLDMDAGHGYPTVDYGVSCTLTASPHINKCNYDGAFVLLNHIYGGKLNPSTDYMASRLSKFYQQEFHDDLHFDDEGYYYIPSGCDSQKSVEKNEDFEEILNIAAANGEPHPEVRSLSECQSLCQSKAECTGLDYDTRPQPHAQTRCWIHTGNQSLVFTECVHHFRKPNSGTPPPGECKVHVVFHGCNQGAQKLGDEFVKNTGYLEAAEANNIILIFPQIKTSLLANPQGCWDWWGYDQGLFGGSYANHNGKQMAAIKKMIDRVVGKA